MALVKRAAPAVLAAAVLLLVGGLIWWIVREPGNERPRPVDIGGPARDVQDQRPSARKTAEPAPQDATRRVADAPPIEPTKFIDPAMPEGIGGVVQNDAGAPLGEAVCELFENLSPIPRNMQEGERRSTFITRPDGMFAFDGNTLSVAERYLLKVSHPEYATDRRAVDLRSPQSGNLRIRLSAGTKISGTVKNAAGAPLARATITVYEANSSAIDPSGSVDTAATTDERGVYTVPNANAGLKKMTASLDGYGTGVRPIVKVEPGMPLQDIDFTLTEGGSITGRVTVQGSGDAVANAWVTARASGNVPGDPTPVNPLNQLPKLPADGELRDRLSPEVLEKLMKERAALAQKQPPSDLPENSQTPVTKSDRPKPPAPAADLTTRSQADGTYVIRGAVVGRIYAVSVTSPGFIAANPQAVTSPASNIDFILPPSARILGRVVDDETGKAVPMFTIALTVKPDEVSPLANAKKAFGPPRFADGKFEVLDVQPGRYWLLAQARGYAGGRSSEVAISAGDRREGVEIRLVRGGSIKGRVVDGKGAPVADATVDADGAVDRGPFGSIFEVLKDPQTVKTLSDGTFVIPNVLGGSWVVGVRHPDFAPYKSQPLVVSPTGETAAPPIVLSRGATIRGRVRLKDGRPDAKALVMITGAGNTPNLLGQRQESPTDEEGRFEISGLAAGQYRVVIVQRDGQKDLGFPFAGMNSTPYTLAEGEIKEVDL